MRVPMGWLKDFVDLSESVGEIAERLTFAGIEVEGIEMVGGNLEGVVVGEVRAVGRHPNADRLSVCTVFDGTQEVTVVCGAPNVRAGGKYAFAPVGVRLANGTVIRRAKLRGIESYGMLCAEDELGLSDDHSGLLELPEEVLAGRPLAEVLGLPEAVLDLEITPNRPDCLSILGIARELAALHRRPLRHPPFAWSDAEGGGERLEVEVREPELCPRYVARVLRGLRVGPSPAAIQRRLKAAGVRPISNLVDVTNYVMLELGQPLHAFDLARLAGGRILVRRAADGERIRTLDGVERALDSEMLVIADAARPVAIAGVMGGEGSEIGPETTDVLLESACFQKAAVRGAARRLGLATESSHRFARGVDVEGVERASRRAASLMLELAGGRAGGFADLYSKRPDCPVIRCRPSRIAALTGAPAPADRAVEIFRLLDMQAVPRGRDEIEVRPPSFRADIREEVDLVEEYARIEGLDRIPAPAPHARVVMEADDEPLQALAAARRQWIALGLVEILNYSLLSPALLRSFGLDGDHVIRLPNALSEEYSALRPSLLPQVVETLGRNRFRQANDGAVFEMGRVFWRGRDGGYQEEERSALALMGAAGRPRLDRRRPVTSEETWRWIRGLWEQWMQAIGVEAWDFIECPHPVFESGRSFEIRVNGEPVGGAGIVRAAVVAEWRIHEPVAAAEVALAPLMRRARRVSPLRAPSVYPAATRDIAFVVDMAVRHADIIEAIRHAAPPELESLELFDIYTGPGVPDRRKSMAYSLTYRSAERTLTDEEVESFHARVAQTLVRDLGAEIRAS